MGDELLLIPPRPSPQVVVTEGIIEDLGLVEPGRMDRCEPGTPPPATGPQILLREPCCVTGIAVVDQVHASQVMMVTPESLQFFDIVHRVLRLDARRLHQAAVNDQEVQNVDRPMPGVLELPFLDRAGNRTTNRVAFQNLMVGYLIGADDAIALLGQAVGVGLAPEDLLSPLFELGIQASRPPVASPVRLQVDVVQDPADGPLADGRHNTVGDGLSGQVLAGPVGNVQALGHGLQAGQFDDLGTLQGGKSRSDVPTAWVRPGGRIAPGVRSGGRCDVRSIHHTESRRPRFRSGLRSQSPRECGRAGLDTKAGSGCERSAEGAVDRQERFRSDAVFGHAWAKLPAERGLNFQHSSGSRISGITYGQGH